MRGRVLQRLRGAGAAVARALGPRGAGLGGRAGWPAACLALALGQSAVIGWLTLDRAALLRSGREIVLTPEPVDPRDLLRGDYVVLDYPIARPPTPTDPAAPADGPRRAVADGRARWALIRPSGDGWRTAALAERRPRTPDPEGGLWLRAVADGFAADRVYEIRRLRFGIERYYLPEGAGRAVEDLLGTGRVQVVVAVGDDGRAAVKALRIDGATVFEEPWF